MRRGSHSLLMLAALASLLSSLMMPRIAHAEHYENVESLNGATIAYINGSVYDQAVSARVDGTKTKWFSSFADCLAAVRAGKADAACQLTPICELAVERSAGELALVPERVTDVNEGFFFPKGSPLASQFNEVVARFRADGTLDALEREWVSADDGGKALPEQDWDAPNGTLAFATTGVLEPLSYAGEGGRAVGYDVELALLIARELGYHLDISMVTMDAIIAEVSTGKMDFGGSLTNTPERAEMVDFSEPIIDIGVGLVVRAEGGPGTGATGTELELGSIEEVVNARIGVVAGSSFGMLLPAAYDSVTEGNLFYYNTNAELVGALQTGRIDSFVVDLPVASLIVSRNDGIGIMPDPLVDDHYGYALQKDSPLTAQVNERIEAYRADGTIEALYQKWAGSDEAAKDMPVLDYEAPNGTLVVAASPEAEPATYLRDGQIVGICPELMALIARDLGYQLEYRSTNIGSLMAELQSGKADIAMSCLSITDERKQVVDMTVPFYDGGAVAVVRLQVGDTTSSSGFLDGLAASFERTFVTESRWKLILGGLGVTMLISLASGALGCALGFLLVLLRRGGNHLAELLITCFQSLMGGLPIVVVLMVFYYVVFGAFDIPGTLVAILAFTLVFGASSGSIMWNAVKAVDIGQTEAGRALGFSDRSTFSLVVLPQAARRFLPLLRGQFVSLVKDTSVVGYIAVQDLTRAGDLIRSRTMEAFFPLIATAIIYFVLCQVLASVLDRLIRRLEPASGPRTIKGVEQ